MWKMKINSYSTVAKFRVISLNIYGRARMVRVREAKEISHKNCRPKFLDN
jgi:hypothetical protein